MSIITISRGTFSGGSKLASCLADNLGYRILSWELLVEAAEQYGVRHDDLRKGLEKAPRFWDRFRIDKQIYLAVVAAALCREAREGNLVFHGHAGHLLLQGVDQVLRVRVIAPMEMRVEVAMAAEGMERREALDSIEARDAERKSWTRFIYGVEWTDPALYDLVINLEHVSIEAACDLVRDLAELPEYQMTEEGLRRIDDLFLANHVRAKLFLNPTIAAVASKIQVKAEAGEVYLSGVLPDGRYLQKVLDTCESLPEVDKLHAAWLGSYTQPT